MKFIYCSVLFITLLGLGACGTSDSGDDSQSELEAIANAPGSATVGSTVELDGSQSTGPITDYGWLMVAVPEDATTRIDNDQSDKASFTPDIAGDYTIRLIVSSDQTLADSDEVAISVTDN